MSQAGIVDFEGSHPQVPTSFVTNSGTAIPIGNTLELLGTIVAAQGTPLETTASGNTVTIVTQYASAAASSVGTNAGLASFSSTYFTVDSNGFVTLNGTGAAETITGNTGGALSPVAGNWNILGTSTASGTIPVQTSGSGNTLTVQVQKSQAIASTNATNVGLAAFNSTYFTVDANGFVSLTGTGAGETITGNTGDALSPTAGNWNIVGTGSITTSGSVSTLTVQLTGLTNHAVLVGAGTTTITKVGPTATTGQVLQSAGLSADPAFSTATYPLTTTINQILYSSAANTIVGLATVNNGVLITSASGVPSILADGTTGQVLTATTGSPPSWIAPATGGTVTSVSVVSANGFAGTVATATSTPAITITTTATGLLSGNGTAITGSAITQYDVLVGGVSNAVSSVGPGTAGQVLQSGGAAANPAYSTATYPSTSGTSGTILTSNGTNFVNTTATYPATTTINQILYSSAANTVVGLATANNGVLITGTTGVPSILPDGTTGQVLTATTGSPPSWVNPATGGTVTSVSVVSANGFAGTVATATTTPAITLTTSQTGLLSGNATAITGTAITQYNVLTAGASNAPNSVAPSATSGVPLISQGASAQPVFGTAVVAGGGSGRTSTTAYAVICGGTTSTGPEQSIASVGTAGQVLTSNGAGALPTFQGAGANAFSSINIQTFSASGTYTPTSGMLYCVVEIVGAGGGGGGVSSPGASTAGAGAGGGAGGYCRGVFSAATIGASQTVTLGTAGTAGANTGGNGGTGGNSTFGSLMTANGGAGGGGVTASTANALLGGAGGTTSGTGVSVGVTGNYGLPSMSIGTPTVAMSGGGGNSQFGPGGRSTGSSSAYGNGSAGTNGGGGAGGLSYSGIGAVTGGAGGAGYCVVTEYI